MLVHYCDNCMYALVRHLCLVIQEIYMSGYAYFHVKLNAILSIFLVQLRPSKIAKRKKMPRTFQSYDALDQNEFSN